MIFYHRTDEPQAILDRGFRDGRSEQFRGVWLSHDEPVEGDICPGETTLSIDVPEFIVEQYEIDDGGRGYRFFVVPADILNDYGPPLVHGDELEGCTREDVLRFADALDQAGKPDRAERMRNVRLPFLERHRLLGISE